MTASCRPFESPSTSSSSIALIALSTKRLNETGSGNDYNRYLVVVKRRKELRALEVSSHIGHDLQRVTRILRHMQYSKLQGLHIVKSNLGKIRQDGI